MSQLTKQQLKGENQTQFPNNNVGAITPSHLRAFNVDMIDSTVNQTDFTNFSGSVAGEIDALEAFSSSLSTAFVSTASFNSYTQSNDQKWTNIGAQSGSWITESESGSFLITASFDNGTRNLTFTKGDASTFAVNIPDVSGSAGDFVTTASFNSYTQSNDSRVNALESATSSYATAAITASSLITASVSLNTITFTKGDGSTFPLTIDTGSGGGGGSIDTGSFATTGSNFFVGIEAINQIPGTGVGEVYLLGRSGSLFLTNQLSAAGGPSYASISHISSSQVNANTNLIFKPTSTTGSTIVSGSNNIFTNPNTPTTNFVRYVGGAGNLYLHSNGVPQITASAASISGNRPTMNGNILGNATTWNINQASNPGTHTYSNNLIEGGSLTFNMLGNTANNNQFNNNILAAPNFLINAPSRSLAQIQAGESGSATLTINQNIGAGSLTYNGPVSASGQHNIVGNALNGTLSLNVQSGSKALLVSNNSINGGFFFTNNTSNVGAIDLGVGNVYSFTNNAFNGNTTVNNNGPSRAVLSNNSIAGTLFVDAFYTASAVTVANTRGWIVQRNLIAGVDPYILISGSADGTYGTNRVIQDNIIVGNNITASLVGDSSKNLASTAIIGRGLNVYGTSVAITSSVGLINYGSAFLGRYNAEDGNRAGSAETVFAIGTGNSGSAGIVRKTGFLIDSGSNTFIEGTLNVSGSTTMTGSLTIQSGSAFFANGNRQFNVGTFFDTTTQSGSAAVSQSMVFNTTDISSGVSMVSGSQITIANSGTYNIQFSAQILADTGADDVYIWLKKNGTNVASSAGVVYLANNQEVITSWNYVVDASAGDYYELAWQSTQGDAVLLTEPAAGNVPGIPSVILTVTQIR